MVEETVLQMSSGRTKFVCLRGRETGSEAGVCTLSQSLAGPRGKEGTHQGAL